MKQIRNISLITLILLYISAGLGYGLHICSEEGSVTPVLMIQDATCENVHDHTHHQGCVGECTSKDNHSDGCCHTEVYQLEDKYETTTSVQIEQPTELLLSVALLSNTGRIALNNLSEEFRPIPEYSPPELVPSNFYSLISVWRL